MKKIKLHPDYLRNLIFGAEDSLVSTVGVMFGVASANTNQLLVLMTGLVVISVEALSMGAGSFLSEETTIETEHLDNGSNPIISGILMFIAYFLAGTIPLAPYLLMPVETAKYVSVLGSLVSLFILGYIPAKRVKSAVRMVIVAGCAIFVGFVIGEIFGNKVI